ncbi:SGNH/GDSL hydrolase family protein [Streptomyces qinzhouensis]|uniref:SGNH/GDSL hydrolase family protein n=1 Tax=Streptomyces qinzhouensis TaxID=2599401 RepID=A0A5B8IEX2_9ACTN|nr:SGNH/GDSL hydrolase family protein [Streptomyces qinzhouensis]QDY76612.1 SGNH/GDSL hydrolase family protein [Streptomyces qinzhouensis]
MHDRHSATRTTGQRTIGGTDSGGGVRTGDPGEDTGTPYGRTGGRRRRSAAAAGVSAALVLTAALAGCDSSSESDDGIKTKGAAAKQAPAFVWDRSPGSIAAVGDSITRSFNACSVLSDCPESSWSTGTDSKVRSLALRLIGDAATVSQRTWNYAKTGAEMADIPAQMTQAAARKPELVTVLVGANDACSDSADLMTPVEEYRASFTGALKQLRKVSPKSQVYVSSVPDLKRLWQTGRTDPIGRQIWKLGFCKSMLKDAEDLGPEATARRARVQERVVAYNKVLKEVCATDLRCRYDGGAVFSYAFEGDQLSRWDWFHPSRNGQSRLAEIAYRNITAASVPK